MLVYPGNLYLFISHTAMHMVVLMTPNHIAEVEDVCSKKCGKRTISNEQSLFYMLSPPLLFPPRSFCSYCWNHCHLGLPHAGLHFQDVANPGRYVSNLGLLIRY